MDTFLFGYRIDPVAGIVYGLRGKPIRKKTGCGYVQVHRRKIFYMMAHRMIWQSVYGPIPEGMEINHINGVKADNRLENLELVSPSENVKHAYRTGLKSAKGVHNGRAILTPIAVRDIRNSSEGYRVLARRYGVGRTTIRDVKSGKNWSNCT